MCSIPDLAKENSSWGYALSLNWNLFDGMATYGSVRGARADLRASQERQRQEELNAALGVREAQIAIRNAREGQNAAEESVGARGGEPQAPAGALPERRGHDPRAEQRASRADQGEELAWSRPRSLCTSRTRSSIGPSAASRDPRRRKRNAVARGRSGSSSRRRRRCCGRSCRGQPQAKKSARQGRRGADRGGRDAPDRVVGARAGQGPAGLEGPGFEQRDGPRGGAGRPRGTAGEVRGPAAAPGRRALPLPGRSSTGPRSNRRRRSRTLAEAQAREAKQNRRPDGDARDAGARIRARNSRPRGPADEVAAARAAAAAEDVAGPTAASPRRRRTFARRSSSPRWTGRSPPSTSRWGRTS